MDPLRFLPQTPFGVLFSPYFGSSTTPGERVALAEQRMGRAAQSIARDPVPVRTCSCGRIYTDRGEGCPSCVSSRQQVYRENRWGA